MKFDIVIGNPPYNHGIDMDFIAVGYSLSAVCCCMIAPAKWQTSDDRQSIASRTTYGEFRHSFVPHIREIYFFPCCKDVFDILQVDGIAYFVMDKHRHDKVIVHNRSWSVPILNSTMSRSIVHRESLLNAGQVIYEHVFSTGGKHFELPDVRPWYKYTVWLVDQCPGGCFATVVKNKQTLFIGRCTIVSSDDNYEPVSTEIRAFSSNSLDECLSFKSWLQSKFTQFFVAMNQSKVSGNFNADGLRFVPAPPNGLFDHEYTDEELYRHFGLTAAHIAVVESVVKSRD